MIVKKIVKVKILVRVKEVKELNFIFQDKEEKVFQGV